MCDHCLYRLCYFLLLIHLLLLGSLCHLEIKDIDFQGNKHNQSVIVSFTKFKHNLSGTPHQFEFQEGPTKESDVLVISNFLQSAVHSKAQK